MEIIKRYLERMANQVEKEKQDVYDALLNQPYVVGNLVGLHSERITEKVLEEYPGIYEGNHEWLETRVKEHVTNISQLTYETYDDGTPNTSINKTFLTGSNMLQMTLTGAPESYYGITKEATVEISRLINTIVECIDTARYYLDSIKGKIEGLPEDIGPDSKKVIQRTLDELLTVLQSQVERELKWTAYKRRLDDFQITIKEKVIPILTRAGLDTTLGTMITEMAYLYKSMEDCIERVMLQIQRITQSFNNIVDKAKDVDRYMDPLISAALNYLLQQKQRIEERLRQVIWQNDSHTAVFERSNILRELPILEAIVGYVGGSIGRDVLSQGALFDNHANMKTIMNAALGSFLSDDNMNNLKNNIDSVLSKSKWAITGVQAPELSGEIDSLRSDLSSFEGSVNELKDEADSYTESVETLLSEHSTQSLGFAKGMDDLMHSFGMDNLHDSFLEGNFEAVHNLKLGNFNNVSATLKEIKDILPTLTRTDDILQMEDLASQLSTLSRAKLMATSLMANAVPEQVSALAERYDNQRNAFLNNAARIKE